MVKHEKDISLREIEKKYISGRITKAAYKELTGCFPNANILKSKNLSRKAAKNALQNIMQGIKKR
jgi:hypothetical protein